MRISAVGLRMPRALHAARGPDDLQPPSSSSRRAERVHDVHPAPRQIAFSQHRIGDRSGHPPFGRVGPAPRSCPLRKYVVIDSSGFESELRTPTETCGPADLAPGVTATPCAVSSATSVTPRMFRNPYDGASQRRRGEPDLLLCPDGHPRQASRRRRAPAMTLCPAPLAPSALASVEASRLPSSTPHWSKLLMSQITP